MEFHAKASSHPASREHVSALLQELRNVLEFIAARDAVVVHGCMAGFGTDDDLLIRLLANRSKPQIAAIDRHYRALPKNKKNQSLHAAVVSETSGNYGHFMKYITQPRGIFLAGQLAKAMQDGIGCNKQLLNSVFCTSTTDDIHAMREAYENERNKKLADVIRSELGGEHEKLILFLLQHGRPVDPADPQRAVTNMNELKDMIKKGAAFVGGLKNEAEEQVSKYIAALSSKQCLEIKRVWMDFEKTIKDKFSGALEEAVLQLMEDPEENQAKQLKQAMDGIGCDEETLSRILGGNHKDVAASIARVYFSKYNVELATAIRKETGGHFETALVTWIAGNDATGGMEPTVNFWRKKFDANELRTPQELETFASVIRSAIDNAKDCVASLDADLLKKATHGIGTDERLVVSIMCARTKDQLDSVDMLYRERYGRTLQEYCERELGGDLKEFLVLTQMEEDECDAHLLHKAFAGIGCDKEVIVEVACTRSSERLAAARQYYERFYDENLMDRLRSELGSGLEHLCLTLFNGCRNRSKHPAPHNGHFDAAKVAADLYAGGAGRWGADSNAFSDILTSHTQEEMKAICDVYDRTYNSSLEAAIKSEFSGAFETALVALLYDPIDLFCRNLKKATDGIGATEKTISRILGSNDKPTIHRITERYMKNYNVRLVDLLSSELYYDYRNACMTYVSTSDITDGMEDRLAQMEIAAQDPPPKPPSKVPDRPAPPAPAPAPKPEPKPEPVAQKASAPPPQPTIIYAPSPPPVIIVYGVMDMNQAQHQSHNHGNDRMARRAAHMEARREIRAAHRGPHGRR